MRERVAEYVAKAGKASVGCCLAMLVGTLLGLQYATAAGVITLLSLQNTKKETLQTALRRLLSFLLALASAFFSFWLLGYTIPALGLYLLLFVFACHLFSLENAIAMCTVLVSHFWLERSMAPALVLNEFLLFFLGAGTGVLLNLFLPSNVRRIRQDQRRIEEAMRVLLEQVAEVLVGQKAVADLSLEELGQALSAARGRAHAAMNNALTIDLRYYVEYVDMRKNQYAVLRRVAVHLQRLVCIPEQAHPLSVLLRSIAASFHEYNNAEELLRQVEQIRQHYRADALPQNREEFEARAVLYQVLNDVEHFLLLKNTFAQALTPEQKALFWPDSAQ